MEVVLVFSVWTANDVDTEWVVAVNGLSLFDQPHLRLAVDRWMIVVTPAPTPGDTPTPIGTPQPPLLTGTPGPSPPATLPLTATLPGGTPEVPLPTDTPETPPPTGTPESPSG